MIEVEHLSKTYGARRVVEDLSLSIEAGEVFGILGPNGAGKTTTVECISGLRTGDGGRVRIDGVDPWSDRDSATRLLGVQLQDSQLQPKITVREAFELFSACYAHPAPWRDLAERLGLSDTLDDRFGRLSGGQQQRLAIGLALVGDPRVVVLDELTTGLDPRARRDTWQLVRELRGGGTTVVLVTHAMEEAQELCDRLAIIGGGRLLAMDTPERLARRAASTQMSFEPSGPLDDATLERLPGVVRCRREAGRVAIEASATGVTEVLRWVLSHGVTPDRLLVHAGSLDQAYLSLTDQHPDQHPGQHPGQHPDQGSTHLTRAVR